MDPYIRIKNLEMRYGSFLIQRDLTFEINRGDVFIIMGGSGCGKSTLLKHLIGLYQPVWFQSGCPGSYTLAVMVWLEGI